MTLNSDDPPMFGTTLTQEYRRAASVLGLSRDQLASLTLNGVRASFLDRAAKRALIGEINDVADRLSAADALEADDVDRGRGQPITGAWSVVGMRPGADRYPPDDTADRPTSLAGSGFAEAYRAHHPGLVKLAAFIVGDQATGEDVVQDVFTRLHQRWDMLADPGDPLPYLRTAVVNGCRSAIKRRGRAQRHAGHDSPSPPLSTEESVLLSEDRQQVLAALARLSRRRREVLVLRFYLGLSEAEIAATLGISPGTVKSTAARGLAALARALRETR